MDKVEYIGMDVHKEAISVAVLKSSGKLVMECTIETKARSIVDFFKGLRGSLHVTLEEGTWSAWLYDLIKPHIILQRPLIRKSSPWVQMWVQLVKKKWLPVSPKRHQIGHLDF